MRLTTLSLLAAHLCATSLLAQTGSMRVLHAPTPTPAPAFKSAPVLAAALAPAASPARLDFPPLFDGDQKTLTVRVTSPAAGYVTGALSDPNFRLVEVRAIGAGFETSAAGGGGVAGRTVTSRSTAAPWQVNVAAGAAVEFDVRCAPKFSLENVAGSKSATLVLTGPGSPQTWRVPVPLAVPFQGVRIAIVARADTDAGDVVEPATSFQVPVTLVGIDHPVTGKFRVKSGPAGFDLIEHPITVPAGRSVTATLRFKLYDVWLGHGSHRPGGVVNLAFDYEGRTAETSFTATPHTAKFRRASWSSTSCNDKGLWGFTEMNSDGTITMHLEWKSAPDFRPDPTKTVRFQAFLNANVYAESLVPKTMQSVYLTATYPTMFRTTFKASDYLPMYKAMGGDFAFTCSVVDGTPHF